MFSISFGEILLIATVGLVVIGPKRLPQAARFAGHLAGRLQRQIQSVKADINREMQAEELKDIRSIRDDFQQAARDGKAAFSSAVSGAQQTADNVAAATVAVTEEKINDGDDNGNNAAQSAATVSDNGDGNNKQP